MEKNHSKILEIAHRFTQQCLADGWNPEGRSFWNYSEVADIDDGIARKYLRRESDQAILNGEAVWPLSDLVYGKAVQEAYGFIICQPALTVDQCVQLMLNPDGHGYGYLLDLYGWLAQRARKKP